MKEFYQKYFRTKEQRAQYTLFPLGILWCLWVMHLIGGWETIAYFVVYVSATMGYIYWINRGEKN